MIIMKCDICGEETDRNYVKDELTLELHLRVDKPKPKENNDPKLVVANTEKFNQPDVWRVRLTVMKNGGKPAEICRKCLLEIVNKTGRELRKQPPVKSEDKK